MEFAKELMTFATSTVFSFLNLETWQWMTFRDSWHTNIYIYIYIFIYIYIYIYFCKNKTDYEENMSALHIVLLLLIYIWIQLENLYMYVHSLSSCCIYIYIWIRYTLATFYSRTKYTQGQSYTMWIKDSSPRSKSYSLNKNLVFLFVKYKWRLSWTI